MVRIVLALLLFVVCCGSLIASEHPATPDTLVITREMLAKFVSFDSLRVRFHAGDDMRWKESNFDDSAWPVVRNDTAGRLLPKGIGWFRGYIHFNPNTVPISLKLSLFVPFAAQEIFLNGKLLYSAGVTSAKYETEIPSEVPLPKKVLYVSTQGTYTLAIRMSTWKRPEYYTQFGWYSGFQADFHKAIQCSLREEYTSLENERRENQTNIIYTVCTAVLIMMMLFLGYLYILDTSERAVIWFALYCLFVVLWMIEFRIEAYMTVSITQSSIGYLLHHYIGNLSQAALLLGAEEYLYGKIRRQSIIITSLLAFTGLILFLTLPIPFVAGYTICAIDLITLWIVFLYTTKNTTSIEKLVVSFGVAIVAFLNIIRYTPVIWIWNDAIRLVSFIALPLAIIVVIVRRTAQDRQRLARYSQDLESDVAERTRELQTANEEISRQMEVQAEQAREIEKAHHESESLLLNILPAPIAHRLKSGERAIADKFDAVTVLFADIVGFTKLSARTTPEELVQGLNAIFGRFDELAKKYGLEKIKTIGDAYMVAGGLPERSEDHAERIARFALEIQAVMQEESLRTSTGEKVELRIGIHTGEAVAGVIGTSKFAYDLWGDTVNTASRMESHGETGKIHCSNEVYQAIKEKFAFEERGEIEVKGKGVMQTYFLTKSLQ